jgi:hypothetical protein
MTEDQCPLCGTGPKTVGHLTYFHNTRQLADFIVNGNKHDIDDTFEMLFLRKQEVTKK